MSSISIFRLNLLRAGYLLLVLGLGATIWPGILNLAKSWDLTHRVVVSMLAALSILAVLGIRYPLQILPLLLFEVAWKAIWLLRVALPLWSAHRMDADTAQTTYECLMAVIFLAIIPWTYVFETYVTKAGDPWWQVAPKNSLA